MGRVRSSYRKWKGHKLRPTRAQQRLLFPIKHDLVFASHHAPSRAKCRRLGAPPWVCSVSSSHSCANSLAVCIIRAASLCCSFPKTCPSIAHRDGWRLNSSFAFGIVFLFDLPPQTRASLSSVYRCRRLFSLLCRSSRCVCVCVCVCACAPA